MKNFRNDFTKEELQDYLTTTIDGSGTTGDADLDFALYNWNYNGLQTSQDAVLVATKYMLPKFYKVDRDVQLMFLSNIFDILLPFCSDKKDYTAMQEIHTCLLDTIEK